MSEDELRYRDEVVPEGVPAGTVDLACRSLGGSVVGASDDSFGAKENLVVDAEPDFTPGRFGHAGEIVDGWETRRRRSPGVDHAIVRLGAPGRIRAVDVDTRFFTGNFPVTASVQACGRDDPAPAAVLEGTDVAWHTIVPPSPLRGDAHNVFAVTDARRFTHVRLVVEPDGGVARLRVHGDVVPDPALLDGLTWDLARVDNGGLVVASSDEFYSRATVLTMPAGTRTMGEGWETRRRRDDGHDWAVVRLAAHASVLQVEVDTTWFVHNASAAFALSATSGHEQDPAPFGDHWTTLLPRTALLPDARQRFAVPASTTCTHVRLDAFPDGGIARLRLVGVPTATGLAALRRAYEQGRPG